MSPNIQKCVLFCTAMLAFNCRDEERSNPAMTENDREGQDRDISYPTPASSPPLNTQGAGSAALNPSPGDPAGVGDPAVRPTAQPAIEDLDDDEIAQVTENVNTAEIQQAELARTKSKNDKVREFAAMMIQHHGDAKRKLAALKLKVAPSDFSRKLEEEGKTTLEQLRSATGSDFDRAYLQAQVDGHTKVLDALNRELMPQVDNEQLKAYLAELKPTVEQHLEQAKRDLESLGSSTRPPKKDIGAGTGTGTGTGKGTGDDSDMRPAPNTPNKGDTTTRPRP